MTRAGAAGPAGGEAAIQAIVGLGNPGRKYADTRHNIGFLVADALAGKAGLAWQTKFQGEFGRARLPIPGADRDVTLLKPQTFMNLSGHPVQAMCAFYGYKPAEIVVVHDELDLPWGRIQIKAGGGHGGHNGLRSIVAQLGSADFVRVRVGIGRPEGSKGGSDAVADYVLSPYSPLERAELPDVVQRAVEAIEAVLKLGVRAAMNACNGPAKPQPGNKKDETVKGGPTAR